MGNKAALMHTVGATGAAHGAEVRQPARRRAGVPRRRRFLCRLALIALFVACGPSTMSAARPRRKKKETVGARGVIVTTKDKERTFVGIVAPRDEDGKGSLFFKDDKGAPTSMPWTEIESISFVGRGRTAKIILRDGSKVTGHPDQYTDSWGDKFPCWSGLEADPDFHFKFRMRPDAPVASDSIRFKDIRKLIIEEFEEEKKEERKEEKKGEK